MASQRLSLAQQIAQLEEAPPEYDPEGFASTANADDESNMDRIAAREHYLDVGPSLLRKSQQSTSDPKYDGKKTSRRKLMQDGDEGSNEAETMDTLSDDITQDAVDEDENDEETPDQESGEPSSSDEEDGKSEPEENQSEPGDGRTLEDTKTAFENFALQETDLTYAIRKSRVEDVKKGKAVAQQIKLWDHLLDTRIRMHKTVKMANKLPPASETGKFLEVEECRGAVKRLLSESLLLSEELFDLRESLLLNNDIITPPPRKRQKVEGDSAIENYTLQLVEASKSAALLEQAFHPYLLQTLSKWSSKIQAVAPSVLLPSNRNAFSKGSHHTSSAGQLIDEALADHDKLVSRTRIDRSDGARIGAPKEAAEQKVNEDPEVFDDSDFYQRILRDIIDARGGNGVNEDWMVLQKQKRAKKKVDTKASKGRKLRYEIQEKLQNFMVPVPMPGAWHDEQIDELFASLLGRGFESLGINVEVERHELISGSGIFG